MAKLVQALGMTKKTGTKKTVARRLGDWETDDCV